MREINKLKWAKGALTVMVTLNLAFTANFVHRTIVDDRDVIEYHFHANIVTEGGDSLRVSMSGDSVLVVDTNSGKEWVVWWPVKVVKR